MILQHNHVFNQHNRHNLYTVKSSIHDANKMENVIMANVRNKIFTEGHKIHTGVKQLL